MAARTPFENEVDRYRYIEGAAHPACLQWVSSRLCNSLGVNPSDLTDAHRAAIVDFIVGGESRRAMFCFFSTVTRNVDTSAAADGTGEEQSNGAAAAGNNSAADAYNNNSSNNNNNNDDASLTDGSAALATTTNNATMRGANVTTETVLKIVFGHPNLSSRSLMEGTTKDVAWFVRLDDKVGVDPDTIDSLVGWGVSRGGNAMDSFLRLMESVMAPTLLRNKAAWPESIQKGISENLHKFMATLTEDVNRMRGVTVLYVPIDNYTDELLANALNDKDLLQKFQTAVNHWSRQITKVVNEKDVENTSETQGPLAEIEYWRSRARDLKNLRNQVNRKEIVQIVNTLVQAKLNFFYANFISLKAEIEKGSEEAISNLHYLSTLTAPCQKLANADPKDIPPLLHDILRTAQMILLHSAYYKKKSFYRLLKMISNEIINRCRRKIDVQAILDGDVEASMIALTESVAAGQAFMTSCKKMLAATATIWRNMNGEQLQIDEGLFNEIDGFVKHRCANLMEICKGQQQFGFKPNTAPIEIPSLLAPSPAAAAAHLMFENEPDEKKPSPFQGMLPCFVGAKGPEIEAQLIDIQKGFRAKMDVVRHLNYDILDVRATQWSDTFRKLKMDFDSLSTMMAQVVQSAFGAAVTVETGAELLESFFYLAKREELIRAVDRRKEDVFHLFIDELKRTQTEIQRLSREPSMPFFYPHYSGRAHLASNLRHRIVTSHAIISRCSYLTDSNEKAEAMDMFGKVSRQTEHSIAQQYTEWVRSLDANPAVYLDRKLVVRVERENLLPILAVNFAPELLELFEEIRFWQRLGQVIPPHVAQIALTEDRLRVVREHVTTAVCDYNNIIVSLNAEDRRLFAERITFVDTKFQQGWLKQEWSMQGIVEGYVRDCRNHAYKLQTTVNEFKLGIQLIQHLCRVMSETPVIVVENKKTYRLEEFEEAQRRHHGVVKQRVTTILDRILQCVRKLFGFFRQDYGKEEIRAEWHEFVKKVELDIETALKLQSKRSLMEIERALPSDKPVKGEATKGDWQLFRIAVEAIPPPNEAAPAFETRPRISDLQHAVKQICLNIRDVADNASRIEAALGAIINAETDVELQEKKLTRINYESPLPNDIQDSYSVIIGKNVETESLLARTEAAFNAVATAVANKLKETPGTDEDRDSRLWATGKQFQRIRRNRDNNREQVGYKDFIDKVVRHRDDILSLDTHVDVSFLQLDYTPLKETYHAQCESVINTSWRMLREEAAQDVNAVLTTIDDVVKDLSEEPKSRTELNRQIVGHAKAVTELPLLRNKIAPIRDKFALLSLDSRNGPIVGKEWEDILKKKDGIEASVERYDARLTELGTQLANYKEQFKTTLEGDIRTFGSSCEQLRKDIAENGPYLEMDPKEAKAKLAQFRRQIAEREAEEKRLHEGMTFFEMDKPIQADLAAAKAELELLTKVWDLTDEWHTARAKWDKEPFCSLDQDAMENTRNDIHRAVNGLGKSMERREVAIKLREGLNLFKSLLPLIAELTHPAIRGRHWEQLFDQLDIQGEAERKADGKDLTLELLLRHHITSQAEFVMGLATAAKQEAKIESDLAKIDEAWVNMRLTIEKHQQYIKLSGTDDIVNTLAEHITILSSMKMSRFVDSFKSEVQRWEQILGKIGDGIEALLGVQGKWMYLESIFIGSDEIKRKLAAETKSFESVHQAWLNIMNSLQRESFVVAAVTKVSIEDLNKYRSALDTIQKGLEAYLEDRRRAFPRFYFLSNDELLEILGNVKDPEKVQPHLRKCFEGLNQLNMKQMKSTGRWVVDAMLSRQGEVVSFPQIVPVGDGIPVEVWLRNCETKMRETVQNRVNDALDDLIENAYRPRHKLKFEAVRDWIHRNEGQMLIAAACINWTAECERAISEYGATGGGGRRKASPVYKMYKKWRAFILHYCRLVREEQNKLQREKLVALITIDVHNRDILRALQLSRVHSLKDFDWSKQLRFYRETEATDRGEQRVHIIRQASATVRYDYEYLGVSDRLVVTALTDRAYMTLTTALHLFRGGLPQGPAGTGKTETVKDLGKALAKYVMVFNCSDGLDYKSLGRMFSGLAQTGSWSCFDEFNRIEVEVLSVVAQQIACILNAVSRRERNFTFEGSNIPLNLNCGIFVTMNPGYAGRSELPDNLKALLRPVSMMVPDFPLICENTLLSQGFNESRALAIKVAILYELMEKQLSKQDHYDFSLRNIKAVLVQAGSLKRENFPGTEEQLCLKAMMDMNLPKFAKDDVPLFRGMLGDLFPGVEPEDAGLADLRVKAAEDLKESDLEPSPHIVEKVIHLWDTLRTRHGVMLVGQSGSGKTTTHEALCGALRRLKELDVNPGVYEHVRVSLLNPKSVTMDELYGSYNKATRDWKDGILSELMRNICRDANDPNYKWLLFDGPVDTLWIESMNTVLDDNKMLTLNSGERINLNPTISILFEVSDLAQASPATVSRCGMVYFNVEDLGWMPYIHKWIRSRKNYEVAINAPKPETTVSVLRKFVEDTMARIIEYKRRECVELFHTSDITIARMFCNMFDAIANPDAAPVVPDGIRYPTTTAGDDYAGHINLVATFCLLWAAGGNLTEESRRKFDVAIREMASEVAVSYPSADTAFEYVMNYKSHGWISWEEHNALKAEFNPAYNTPYYKLIVPTVDTIRYSFLVTELVRNKVHLVLVGNTGTGKSLVARNVTQALGETHVTTQLNFSAQTTARNVQEIIEGKMEHKSKKLCSPPGGRRMVCLIEDLNMPQKEKFGAQPPLELLRQWLDNGFWYDRTTRTRRQVNDMQLLCCMTSGRPEITNRFASKLSMLNVTFPSDNIVTKIFTSILNWRFQGFSNEIVEMADFLVKGTSQVYQRVTTDLLPIPSKSHYLFNLRDLSKVFQGICAAHLEAIESKEQMCALWVHECMRVFQDRMNDPADNLWFKNLICDKLGTIFQTKWSNVMKGRSKPAHPFTEKESPMFVDFWDGEQFELAKYRLVPSINLLKTKVEDVLDRFNSEPGCRSMNLIFFTDALEHLCRIHRIIRQPRGNALLIGLGGSGRSSLTRLACYLAGYSMFQIEIHKKYDSDRFHDDLKVLYRSCGVKQQQRVFYFSDNQIVNVSFLEDLNNMLSTGEVPNLFPKDEMAEIRQDLEREARAMGIKTEVEDEMYNFFIDRARENLHLVVAMSPAHKDFRHRLRQFPALVSCTSIDWFVEWPSDALKELALRFLDENEREIYDGNAFEGLTNDLLSDVFVFMHDSTGKEAIKLRENLKRHTYITPSSYMDFVRGFRDLISNKRLAIKEQRDKLENGMDKLHETTEKVGKMSEELKEKEKEVSAATKEVVKKTEDINVRQDEINVRNQAIAVESAKIDRERKIATDVMDEANEDLAKAQPQLDAAIEALNVLNKKDISEMRTYAKPPELVRRVVAAVNTFLKVKPDWAEAQKLMSEPDKFITSLRDYDKNNMSDKLLNLVERTYLKDKDFTKDEASKVSTVAGGLCAWVRAMHEYGQVYKKVKPKQDKAEAASRKVAQLEESLQAKLASQRALQEALQRLEVELGELRDRKNALEEEARLTKARMDRANIIVNGLSGEQGRWTSNIEEFNINLTNLIGDGLLASGYLSYTGAFPAEYRQTLMATWLREVKRAAHIPFTKGFEFVDFLVDPTEVREWQSLGLPGDDFSKENAVIVTRGSRWPLMIDPQMQAVKWVKRMEKDNFLKVIDQKQPDFLKTVEHAIINGWPLLLQDVLEEIDPSLDAVISKAVVRKGGRAMIKMGDNEIEYNKNFRMYITTRLANPHYTPETCVKVSLLNFAVKEQGLEEQLLKIVIRCEHPELEEKNEQLILSTAANNRETKRLQDEVLNLLATSTGDLLDNQKLITTLQTSTATAAKIKIELEEAEKTSINIRNAREEFRPCARRASLLFFVLADFGGIDTMYQFSLDSYIHLFENSIQRSADKLGSTSLEERILTLNNWHTDAVYNSTCRALFEKHKLLLSLHMTMRILMDRKEVNNDEYIFLMRGGQILDKQGRSPNPCPQSDPWLSERAWDNILELEKLLNFHGIVASFEQNLSQWRQWFLSEVPEDAQLPSEWQNKTADNYLQRMILVRCLRPDRILFMVYQFVTDKLGKQYVEPPAFNLRDTYEESSNTIPLVFVLSPGVDPATQLGALAAREGCNLRSLALGQGQDEPAKRQIAECAQSGGWVFLANCHLMVSWLPDLEKIIDELSDSRPHENFRLWLSSIPTPAFPIGILQRAVKMTTEPPSGLKSNMLRLYNYFNDEEFQRTCVQQPQVYRTLLFSLCFFHSVLLERRKFGTLGYNVVYDFTYSDFEVSENIIKMYVDEMEGGIETIPFVTLRYLIAEASYGGRVTDDWDRRLINTYIDQFMCPSTVVEERYALSSAEAYFVPGEVATLAGFKKTCADFPITDPPEAFGQHGNADIASQISNSMALLDDLIVVNATLARTSGSSAESKAQSSEDRCLAILASLQEPSKAATPVLIDYDAIYEATNEDRASALNTCLLQEIQRYNALLRKIHRQKGELRRAVKGEIVMNDELDAIFHSLLLGRVPVSWTSAYPSSKPLASWSMDLVDRVDQMRLWGQRTPKVFWLAGFTYPTGFLKSLQQQQARRDRIAIDQYGWEFFVLPSEERTIMNSAKEGAYVRGIYLEGAGWSEEGNCMCEPKPMELIVNMPIIHFKPRRNEGKQAVNSQVYKCPLYMYPVRTGSRERPSYVVTVDLSSGEAPPEHWIKRGSALLLATSD